MSFPELTTWTNNLVTLLQLIGAALIAICVAIYSAPFWQMLRDRGKLSAEEAREAAVTTFEAVISAAKERARVRKRKPTLHKETRP